MRVVPIGIGFAGEELDRAASISARLTHGHPNAAEAAVATCRLLRAALERGGLDAALVEETIRGLPSDGVVAASGQAALAVLLPDRVYLRLRAGGEVACGSSRSKGSLRGAW